MKKKKTKPKAGMLTIPRIIGIVCIVIAIICYYAKLGRWLGLGIAGLILLLTPKNYSKKVFTFLTKSFKLGKWFAFSMLYDILFWLAFVIAIILCASAVDAKTQAIATQLTQPEMAEALQANTALINSIINTLITWVVILFIVTIIVYTIFKGLIWLTLFKQKPKMKFFYKFLGLNAIWLAAWTAVSILLMFGIKLEMIVPVLTGVLFVFLHFTTILHTNYLQTNQVGSSLGKAFTQGIGKIHHFIVPYTYVFLVYVILFQIYRLILPKNVMIAPTGTAATGVILSLLFIVAYFAWLRNFIKTIIQSIIQKG